MNTNKSLNKAIKDWKNALMLQNWDVNVDVLSVADYRYTLEHNGHDGPDGAFKDSWGVNSISMVRHASHILMNGACPENQKERTLVHELSHILLHDMFEEVMRFLSTIDDEKLKGVFEDSFRNKLEIATENVTRALINTRDIAHKRQTLGMPPYDNQPEVFECIPYTKN